MSFTISTLLSIALFIIPSRTANVPLYDYDLNTTKYCTWWYDNWAGATCAEVLISEGVTLADLLRWNPSLKPAGNTCSGWTENNSYCVDTYGEPYLAWISRGCYVDGADEILPGRMNISGGDSVMTVEACQSACAEGGHNFTGVENASECYCAAAIKDGAMLATDATTNCNIACLGNPKEVCGGDARVDIYERVTKFSTYTSPVFTTTTPPTTTTKGPISTATPTWKAEGCYLDEPIVRTLDTRMEVTGGDSTMTITKCQTACWEKGFSFAGLENGNECYCGFSVRNEKSTSDLCTIDCAGEKGTTCGGSSLISVWSATVPSSTTSTKKVTSAVSISTTSSTTTPSTTVPSTTIPSTTTPITTTPITTTAIPTVPSTTAPSPTANTSTGVLSAPSSRLWILSILPIHTGLLLALFM